jgi:FMN phosphatase YigB (HAD superfamily)
MKIFLDFDRTLFDLDAFHREAREALEEQGLPEGAYLASKQPFSTVSGMPGGSYTPERHEAELERLFPGKGVGLASFVRGMNRDGRRFVFPGAEEFLREIANHELVILTFGNDEYQRYKIAGSGLEELVDRIIVTDEDKWSAMRSELSASEEAIFVDDHGGYFLEKPEDIAVCGVHLVRAGQPDCGDCLAQVHVSDLVETLQTIRKTSAE